MKDFLGACLLGAVLGGMFAYGVPAKAQTIPMTNAQGYTTGSVQINGNKAQFVNTSGVTTQIATIYPNQIVIQTPSGVTTQVIGGTGYTVPASPQVPMTPRVMQ
jgi:urease alpha subunit